MFTVFDFWLGTIPPPAKKVPKTFRQRVRRKGSQTHFARQPGGRALWGKGSTEYTNCKVSRRHDFVLNAKKMIAPEEPDGMPDQNHSVAGGKALKTIPPHSAISEPKPKHSQLFFGCDGTISSQSSYYHLDPSYQTAPFPISHQPQSRNTYSKWPFLLVVMSPGADRSIAGRRRVSALFI